jgi:predicted methyltransferase
MLHEPVELSVTRVKSGAVGRPESVDRIPKIKSVHGLLACAILALMAANPSSSKTPSAELASAAIADAVADSSRPASDTVRDVNRKPLETLAFAGVKPGDKIADYAATHPNVTVTFASALDAAQYSQKLDVFWISQNYHDLHDSFMGPVDMPAFNRTVYTALKPGGVYLVLDHVAAQGSRADVADTLHRIEPSTVRREVEAAGFTFEGESHVLANPADPHTAGVFDPSIQGRTDQFILKFRRSRSTAFAAPP